MRGTFEITRKSLSLSALFAPNDDHLCELKGFTVFWLLTSSERLAVSFDEMAAEGAALDNPPGSNFRRRHDDEFYFEDGSGVLLVEGVLFNVSFHTLTLS